MHLFFLLPQITEMYSTGGDLHLELLSGSQEGQKNVWNIPPYHTRPLMKANFVARRENNHTAYVRYGLHVHFLFCLNFSVLVCESALTHYGLSTNPEETQLKVNLRCFVFCEKVW